MKKKSARAWIRRTTEPRKISPKREAARQAAGETRIYSSIQKSPHSGIKQKPKKAIRKVGKQKAKRQERNRAYYASAEWKAKKKAVHERDGFQCVEIVPYNPHFGYPLDLSHNQMRCPNRGEIVNHKQTARGLVCEETSYRHRGVEGYIDTCKTRCKDCDRRLTPLERINHRNGFQQQHVAASLT